jgi:hypothetical protein
MSDLREVDACQVCNGWRGGEPGNENIVAGVVVCDYCHATLESLRRLGMASPALAATERERALEAALRAVLEWMEDVELSDHDILRDDAHNAGFYMTLAMVRRALLSAPPAPTEEAP